jgi:hypothetical protein
MMKKRLLVLAGAFFMLFPNVAYAASPDETKTVESSEASSEAENIDHGFEYGEDNSYFRTQEEFDQWFDRIKKKIAEKPDDSSAFVELYYFISGGGATKEQAESVINEGYLREYIDSFKKNGVISEDFVLNSDKESIKTNLQYDNDGSFLYNSDTLGHYYDNLDEETIGEIAKLLFDDDPNDAYIGLNDRTTASTKLPLMALTASGYNKEPLTIDYYDLDLQGVYYGWTFDHQIFSDSESEVDLAVDLTDDKVLFDLGVQMVQPVELHFYAGEADTEYNVIDTQTEERQVITSNENGMLSIYDADGKGEYKYEKRVKKEIDESKAAVINSITERRFINLSALPDGIIIKILIGALALIGVVLIVLGIKRK